VRFLLDLIHPYFLKVLLLSGMALVSGTITEIYLGTPGNDFEHPYHPKKQLFPLESHRDIISSVLGICSHCETPLSRREEEMSPKIPYCPSCLKPNPSLVWSWASMTLTIADHSRLVSSFFLLFFFFFFFLFFFAFSFFCFLLTSFSFDLVNEVDF